MATIEGLVTDQAGAAMPNVAVTIVNTTTGYVRAVVTDAMGLFSVSDLTPGHYRVRASAPGFENLVREVEVKMGGVTGAKLTLGSATAPIDVMPSTLELKFKVFPSGRANQVSPGGVCSVPLLEAQVNTDVDPKIAREPSGNAVAIPQAVVPAPSCSK
jgi:hypothetical protein